LGIPTDVAHAGEKYLEKFGMYVSGYEESPYRIEWMRFEPNSPSGGVRVAFIVDNGAPVEFLEIEFR
ncbi:MAG: hypothetical protein KAU49_05645, partial [Candidatus Krumholzibacteria bacterium]|nr:hypothetical protein [Candidatus Krumholzibacteria bacterium]